MASSRLVRRDLHSQFAFHRPCTPRHARVRAHGSLFESAVNMRNRAAFKARLERCIGVSVFGFDQRSLDFFGTNLFPVSISSLPSVGTKRLKFQLERRSPRVLAAGVAAATHSVQVSAT